MIKGLIIILAILFIVWLLNDVGLLPIAFVALFITAIIMSIRQTRKDRDFEAESIFAAGQQVKGKEKVGTNGEEKYVYYKVIEREKIFDDPQYYVVEPEKEQPELDQYEKYRALRDGKRSRSSNDIESLYKGDDDEHDHEELPEMKKGNE